MHRSDLTPTKWASKLTGNFIAAAASLVTCTSWLLLIASLSQSGGLKTSGSVREPAQLPSVQEDNWSMSPNSGPVISMTPSLVITSDSDYAVLKLSRSLEFNKNVAPIPLASANDSFPEQGTLCNVTTLLAGGVRRKKEFSPWRSRPLRCLLLADWNVNQNIIRNLFLLKSASTCFAPAILRVGTMSARETVVARLWVMGSSLGLSHEVSGVPGRTTQAFSRVSQRLETKLNALHGSRCFTEYVWLYLYFGIVLILAKRLRVASMLGPGIGVYWLSWRYIKEALDYVKRKHPWVTTRYWFWLLCSTDFSNYIWGKFKGKWDFLSTQFQLLQVRSRTVGAVVSFRYSIRILHLMKRI